MNIEKVGIELRAEMARQCLNKTQLAELAGMTTDTLTTVFAGHKGTSVSKYEDVAHALGKRVSWNIV